MISLEGTLQYDPPRTIKNNRPYWLVLNLPDEIVKYYQWFVRKELFIDIKDPLHSAHVSIVRGEVPPNIDMWKKYDGMKLQFQYYPYITMKKDNKNPGNFFFIEFDSDEIMSIRDELGLYSKYSEWHFTIGRTHYD
ncbi:hypothetical protein DIDNDMLP_00476 [Klebsiella phage KP13-7]|uniref:Uncharacterized protein n=1 Tax=Klebsiella phage vB_KleM_RaK2 TaxID=1147094 RepID=H6X3I5_9CAUD|nr:hypothetical protein F403_gp507 [Klebsiella phage vB_KleM_RaK2]AFA44301.1 hypothetical protein RaK2_00028 [Klebsiella phage vB_KleM_RaK2]UYL05461.1 hypothetical protein DIDNDMLP_00476 [Klebsiella phage KP13-7]